MVDSPGLKHLIRYPSGGSWIALVRSLLLAAFMLSFSAMFGCQQASTSPVLDNEDKYHLEFTHTIENSDSSRLHRLDLYLLVPRSVGNETEGNVAFDPSPAEFLTDNWGQRVAHYVIEDMPGKSHLDFAWRADVRISDVSFQIDPNADLRPADIPSEIVRTYTADDVKYRLSSPVVQKAAEEAIASELGLYRQVRGIYDYVINHLSYSREDGWDDAATVLDRGNGSCSEYSFVLIALCRANGIPARWVGGSRLRETGDYVDRIFHRAVEVYLPRFGWVPVDADLGQESGDPAAYFLQRHNTFFVLATAGGESNLLSWSYNSFLKPAEPGDAAHIVSTRLMQWSLTTPGN